MRRITALGYLAPCLLLGATAATGCATGVTVEPGAGGEPGVGGANGGGGGGGGTGLTGPCQNDETADCYTGDETTENVGECKSGTTTCDNHQWGACQGEILPSTEVCNGKDDDCDGEVDDGNPNSGGTCSTGEYGPCNSGTQQCLEGMVQCVTDYEPIAEECNGVDDDCSGAIDDGNPGGGASCSTGLPGICAAGLMTCTGGSLQCVPLQPATTEVCDNQDNDCDGSTDEGNPCQAGYQCSNGTCVWICPYLYAHDGTQYVYETSIGGSGLCEEDGSGRPIHATSGRVSRHFNPLWARLDSARVSWRPALAADRGGDRTPVWGRVRAKVLAAEDEVVYLRRAHLTVVEHPAGCEVFSSSSADYRPIRRPDPRRLWALRSASLRPPERAVWCDQMDVTDAIAVKNDEPVAYDRDVENCYDLDFGVVRHPEAARLVIDGWKFREQRNLPPGSRPRLPRLEVLQADGSWRAVSRVANPRGDRKPVVVDLGGIEWPTGRYRMRLSLGTHQRGQAMWYVDRVRLTEDRELPVKVSQLDVAQAELQQSGPPTLLHPDQPDRPRLSSDDGGGRAMPERSVAGMLTRYGSVAELVAGDDDRLVVMDRGDGVELWFEGIEPPAPGSEQSLFLVTELLYKPRLMVGQRAHPARCQSVEPLPYARRPAPYLPDEVSHRRYLATYQRRRPGQGARPLSVAT